MFNLSNCKPNSLVPWVGGKSKLYKQIISIIKQFENPFNFTSCNDDFCGALGFTIPFYKDFSIPMICSDTNPWIIDSYKEISKNPNEVYKHLKEFNEFWQSKTKLERKEWYYKLRTKFNKNNIESSLKAAIFITLVKTGYNGLIQINNKNELTTAFGFGVSKNIITKEKFDCFYNTIKNWKFYLRSYEKSIIDVIEGSFVYWDPPYYGSKKMYNKRGNFNEKTLGVQSKKFLNRGAKLIAISNSYYPEYWRKLFGKQAEIFDVKRNQGAHRNVVEKGRFEVKENLIILRG